MTASSSNSARPSSSRQPGNLGSKATAQAALGDSCLQQPRQVAANLINYLLIRGHRYPPSGGTGRQASGPTRKVLPPMNYTKRLKWAFWDTISGFPARQQPKQPWGTHASSSQGRMLRIWSIIFLQASKHPKLHSSTQEVGGRGGSLQIYIYIYIYTCTYIYTQIYTYIYIYIYI